MSPRRAFFLPALLLPLLLVVVIPPGAVLQAQELEWAKSVSGGYNEQYGIGIAADEHGNSYVTGGLWGSAIFGAGEANETVLISSEMFVAKYASDGSLLWATGAGSTRDIFSRDIVTDGHGNSYVTGSFAGTATFAAGEANETVLTAPGSDDQFVLQDDYDMFVAKYGPDGDLLWATSAGRGADDDRTGASGSGIATDRLGNIYVTGHFYGAAVFGADEANETVIDAVGSADIFVAKYAPDGPLLWATSAGGAGIDAHASIATDPSGNSLVTGGFEGTAIFGAGEAHETLLAAGDLGDVFLAKYGPDGALLWVTSTGGVVRARIGTDDSGHSYVAGNFPPANAGDAEVMFVAKYAPDGTLLWTTTADDHAEGIATDPRGNSYVTGEVGTLFSSMGIFVAKYAPDGTLLWVTTASGDWSYAIATDGRAGSYVTGSFTGRATFGAGEPNETVFTAAGDESDAFVAKYRDGAVEDDSDGDGVADAVDFCPGTVLPEAVPTRGRLLPNRFAITDAGPTFSTHARGAGKKVSFTIFDTQGCSCEQIIDYLGLGQGHRKHGCSLGVMRSFIKELPEHGDGVVEDSDGDGVADADDFCPATRLPEAVPTRGRLLPNRFAITDEGPAFSTHARGAGKKVSFTIFDTQGCSCEQIIDYLGLGQGHRKHGCSLGVMRTFIEGLPE